MSYSILAPLALGPAPEPTEPVPDHDMSFAPASVIPKRSGSVALAGAQN
jgi:hypothetical protein